MTDEDRAILDAMPLHQPMTAGDAGRCLPSPVDGYVAGRTLTRLTADGYVSKRMMPNRAQYLYEKVREAPEPEEAPRRHVVRGCTLAPLPPSWEAAQ